MGQARQSVAVILDYDWFALVALTYWESHPKRGKRESITVFSHLIGPVCIAMLGVALKNVCVFPSQLGPCFVARGSNFDCAVKSCSI